MKHNLSRVNRAQAGLVVVDIQEKLLPAMFEKERVTRNSEKLIRGARILGVPIVATEQYRKGLGRTVAEIAAALENFAPLEKLTFSACGAEGWPTAFTKTSVSDFMLCGIECHVCVTQTCLDLLDSGFRVFVVEDATSSHTAETYRAGLARMRDAGAVIVSTEMILFELLGKAGTDEFKQVLNLIK